MKKDDVRQYDGKNGNSAYIIFENKVYDVTDSKMWKNGIHMNRHKAGEDMTDFISMAPHGADLLEKDNIKYVADLEEEETFEDKKQKYRRLYSKLHPHPVFIHYPMGIIYFGAFMLLLYLFTGNNSFEVSAYYALIVGTLSIFPAVVSGFVSWWLNYEMTMTKVFKNKIVFSAILTFLLVMITIVRFSIQGDLSSALPALKGLYILGYFVSIPVLTFIAFNGGKITWPS